MLFNKNNFFNDFGYMVDCSRGAVPKVETLKKLIDILSAFGYNYLMLYTEDTYEIDGEPYFGYMRGRYSKKEIEEIDKYCISKGLELRACIQTLAHLGRIKRHSCYTNLFELDDILMVKDERVYEFIDKMFNTVSKMFTSKKVHIGMDEAWALGRGTYLDKYGNVGKRQIMSYHLRRVSNIAKKYGFECDIWADMLLNAYYETKDKDKFSINIPKNITPISWRYYRKSEQSSYDEFELYLKLSKGNLGFAGGAQKWSGFVPDNTYSFWALDEQIKSCIKYNVKRFLLTAWSDGAADASLFSTIPTLFYASLKAHNLQLDKKSKAYFKSVIGMSFENYMLVDKLNRIHNDTINSDYNNLSFIFLYNDLLQGLFDEAVSLNCFDLYNSVSKMLTKNTKNDNFGYIFKSYKSLANVLKYKSTLGLSIYNNYLQHDLDGLKNDALSIKRTKRLLKQFMKDYEEQWHLENKSFGYEKQNIRLGGLYERLNYVENILNKYINGTIDKIEELEEEHLPISVNWWNHERHHESSFHNYSQIVSSGMLKEI